MAKRKVKGLVISGGASWGAMGVGTLARMNKNYQHIAAISTGALMSPLVALKEWDVLKEAYTSVNQSDIYDKKKWYEPNQFKKNGGISILNLIWAQLSGKVTAGTSNNLRKLIDNFITEEQFETLKYRKITLAVGTNNIKQSPAKMHYFDINDENYNFEDFKDWMWASANPPIFFSLMNKKWYDAEDDCWYNGQWTDGGLTQLLALDYLSDKKKCDEIDVLIHRAKPEKAKEIGDVKDLYHNAERCFIAMRDDIAYDSLPDEIEKLNKNGVSVRLIWLPRKPSDNSLIFNQQEMLEWYQEGYDTALDKNRIDEFLV